MLPIIALKGGRGGKGKLLACPIYKRMNVQTAHDLSALAREGERRKAHTALETAQLRVGCFRFFCDFEMVQSVFIRVTGLCSTLDLHLCTSALETGYLGELQLGSAERAAHAVLAARSLSLGPARQWCAGALDSARYREHFAGSTLQGALYREHFTGSTLQGALCCNCSYRRILYD